MDIGLMVPVSGSSARAVTAAPSKPRMSSRMVAALVAGAWALSYLCDLLNLDVLLIPLVFLAFASVLRTGTGTMDRLVVAVLVGSGVILIVGLVTSLTPVRMLPAPSAAILLTLVVAAAWTSRREPRIPLRFRGTDLLIAGSGAVALYYIHKPLAGLSPIKQLIYSTTSEDRFTHFATFDAVHVNGGYGFYHGFNPNYPQGMHYLLAWLDTFLRSSADPGPTPAEFYRYFVYIQILFAFMVAAVVWAARWIAEPHLRGWRSTTACAAVASVMLAGAFVNLVVQCFDAEVLGLALVVVACALSIRPASSAWEHLAIAGLATVAITYTYNAYVVFVVGSFACSTFIYRRRYKGRLRLMAAGYVGFLVVAAYPTLRSLAGGMDYKAQALLGGNSVAMDKSMLAGLVFLVLASLAAPASRRLPRPAAAAATVGGAVTVLFAFAWWQEAEAGSTSYYTSKFVAGCFVLALIAAPVSGFLLISAVSGSRGGVAGTIRRGLLTVGTCVVAVTILTGVRWGLPGDANSGNSWRTSALVSWSGGASRDGTELLVEQAFENSGAQFGTSPVIVLSSNDGYMNYRQTRFFATLQRRSDLGLTLANTILRAHLGGPVDNKAAFQSGMGILETSIKECTSPPYILVGNRQTADRIRQTLSQDQVSVTVLWYPLV